MSTWNWKTRTTPFLLVERVQLGLKASDFLHTSYVEQSEADIAVERACERGAVAVHSVQGSFPEHVQIEQRQDTLRADRDALAEALRETTVALGLMGIDPKTDFIQKAFAALAGLGEK